MGVIDGTVVTAPLSNAILPSITRGVVLEVCSKLSIPVREFPMTEEEMRDADELLVTGTASEVTPVVSLDGRPVGSGKPGPITMRIQRAFLDLTKL